MYHMYPYVPKLLASSHLAESCLLLFLFLSRPLLKLKAQDTPKHCSWASDEFRLAWDENTGSRTKENNTAIIGDSRNTVCRLMCLIYAMENSIWKHVSFGFLRMILLSSQKQMLHVLWNFSSGTPAETTLHSALHSHPCLHLVRVLASDKRESVQTYFNFYCQSSSQHFGTDMNRYETNLALLSF